MTETEFVEKIKTHFMFNNFFSENRTVYEIMSGKYDGTDGSHDVTIWRIRVSC